MAFKLLLENGKVKCYHTAYGASYSGNGDITTYQTKCGLKWIDKPATYEECNHLDCAIMAADEEVSSGWLAILICAIMVVISPPIASRGFWEGIFAAFSIIFFLAMGLFLISSTKKDADKSRELKEFRDHGTVNGIKARQV